MLEIKKSKIEKIQEKEKWNDLFKFEMNFEDGTEGFMFKKTQDPMCSVGDLVQFTQNDKGTIKIIKEGSEKFVNQPTHNQIDDDVIMIQCMFKAASAFYAHKSSITEIQVSETAKLWFESAKEILKKKTNKSDEAPF
tara:strand:- start:2321 stop:2731 length:411 start_codon:yes stop_codon:yes gene_type:complete